MIRKVKAKSAVMPLMRKYDLQDTYRAHHPKEVAHTWEQVRLNKTIRRRLDYILISSEWLQIVLKAEIGQKNQRPWSSDHLPVMVTLKNITPIKAMARSGRKTPRLKMENLSKNGWMLVNRAVQESLNQSKDRKLEAQELLTQVTQEIVETIGQKAGKTSEKIDYNFAPEMAEVQELQTMHTRTVR